MKTDQKIRVLALDSEDDASIDVHSRSDPTLDETTGIRENVFLERKIYLRAALRLLDQRDQILDEKTPDRSATDIIKSGTLKKATGSSVTRAWKEKYVELRHGNFAYGDHSGWGQTLNWKTIRLQSNEIGCCQVKSSGLPNQFIFALKESHGEKRLWMVDSYEEMIAWIDAIKTATIGSAGDFALEEPADIDQSYTAASETPRQINSNDHLENSTVATVPLVQLWHKSEHVGNDQREYFDGLPAHLSAEIRKYIFLQTAISNSTSPTSYRELLELYFSEPHFTIPISFIKSQIAHRTTQSKHSKNKMFKEKKKFVPTEYSQAWKDLHRDIMVINGEKISGGVGGPEAMLGVLVRIILNKVQQMRERYLENVPVDSYKKKMNTFADLDESQALSCARDILLSCNRTESGGDTYLAIESLLINKEFAVLTPFASEEEPIEIIVDIVESKHRPMHTVNIHLNDDSSHQLNPTKRMTDDSTDSSGLSYSVSNEDESRNTPRLERMAHHMSQFHDPFGFNNIEPSELAIPSDIEGATAIKSSILQSKHPRRRKAKEGAKMNYQGSGNVSDSSNCSDYSSTHPEESFIPETSLEETSESAEDIDQNMSNSFDSGDSPPLDKNYFVVSPTLTRLNEDELTHHYHDDDHISASPDHLLPPTTLEYNSNHFGQPDDITLDLSEVTLDSALLSRDKLNSRGPFSKAMKFVSPNHKNEKGLLSHILKRDGGGSTKSVNDSEKKKSRTRKTHSTFSGIRRAFRSKNSKSDLDGPEDEVGNSNPAAQSMCIRIQMIAKSKYRLCNVDPQNELEDHWAVVHGSFHQVFFLKSHSNGRPSMSDRLVTIKVASAR